MIRLRLIFLLSVFRASSSEECQCETTTKSCPLAWSYRNNAAGPRLWRKWYPECEGERQSPVPLCKRLATRRRQPVLDWKNYNSVPNSLSIGNTGNTVTVVGSWSSPDKTPQVHLHDRHFVFHSIVLHWGSNGSLGSEHTINTRRYPLEMQVLHTDMDDKPLVYGGWDSPQENDRNLLICILFEEVEKPMWDTSLMEFLVSNLPNVRAPGTVQVLQGMPLNRIVPRFYRDFFMYHGSLTSPPCTQSTTVIVSSSTAHVTKDQLHALRCVRDQDSEPMMDNYRPLQPLYGRCISFVS